MSALDHVDDYPEIPVSLESTRAVLKTGAWRNVRPVFGDAVAPCSLGCPAGVGVPAFLELVSAGQLDSALSRFIEQNPFPRITGRVCPHLCEASCNLGHVGGDESVSIRSIERWLGDATSDLPFPRPRAATNKEVAVVGSGPAGLSAAYYLRRTGHAVTVYERREAPGGMLRHAIPGYRLPREVVDGEVSRLAAMGVEFRTGIRLGVDVTLDELSSRYAAVFVATGAERERDLGIEGSNLAASGLEFLAGHGDDGLAGRRCAVIGGGNTAMDVARSLQRLGARVTVLYRRTAAEMPALEEEYLRAVSEGVSFEFLALPRAIESRGGDLMITVESMRLGAPDGSGRPQPEPTGVWRRVAYDRVFAAIGEVADLTPFPERMKDSSGRLVVSDTGATADDRIHAGGDLVTGPATVVAAIVAGRAAARRIDELLGFGARWPHRPVSGTIGPSQVNPANRRQGSRVVEPLSRSPGPFAEETLTISGRAVAAEAGRCLSCGHCNACGTCLVFCPDAAIRWEGRPVIDYEYCKGCGICVTECPGHALVLIEEGEVRSA